MIVHAMNGSKCNSTNLVQARYRQGMQYKPALILTLINTESVTEDHLGQKLTPFNQCRQDYHNALPTWKFSFALRRASGKKWSRGA